MSFELRHKLFNNLDNPMRFLVWTLPEAMMLWGPLFVGFATGYVFTNLIFSAVGFYLLREVTQRFGKQSLAAVLYWYFPPNKRKLKVTPPSYIRGYLG